MSNLESLIVLVNSLTKAEKRYLKLYSNLQKGDKIYMSLFSLIQPDTTPEELTDRFLEKYDGKSIDTAIKHLYQIILESLLRKRNGRDMLSVAFEHITRSKILKERNMYEEAMEELLKAQRIAVKYEYDTLLVLIYRMKITLLNNNNFKDTKESDLASKFVKLDKVSLMLRRVNHRFELYNILCYRTQILSKIHSEEQKKWLDDLVLSEIYETTRQDTDSFEFKKMHLLFQATYYLNVGNHKIAISSYRELIKLFEKNSHLILNPPTYYLNALLGILDSLSQAAIYSEMPFFLSKLAELDKEEYACEFRLYVKTLLYLYRSNILLNEGKLTEALLLKKEFLNKNDNHINTLDTETRLRLYLNTSVLALYMKDYPQVKRSLGMIFRFGKIYDRYPYFRIARFINLLYLADKGERILLENEYNSLKREMKYGKQANLTEKLIFKFIKEYPLPLLEKDRIKLWQKYDKDIHKMERNKFERHFQSIFNVGVWIENKLTKKSVSHLLGQVKPSIE